jgi:hypothetical protein
MQRAASVRSIVPTFFIVFTVVMVPAPAFAWAPAAQPAPAPAAAPVPESPAAPPADAPAPVPSAPVLMGAAPPAAAPPLDPTAAAVSAPAEPPREKIASALAIELGTGGLSAPQGGALGIGWGSSTAVIGLGFDLRHSSLTGPGAGSSTPTSIETAVAFGLWLRFNMVETADGRVSLFGALDAQYAQQTTTVNNENIFPNRVTATASGGIFRIGPGVRFWATSRLAIGYAAQLQLSEISGPLLALTQDPTVAGDTSELTQAHIDLVGRFTVMALF